ncbi:DUF6691 family protein [Roseibium suaedae]|uniref:YeeE/YedE family protein n=1 Tax=Roseibium suaedae TaxID=735517 RepID=A0A1M6Z4L0_9HYPH|nr:DUF6691 family protein [Roseibium suaedae]SHL25332.1 hypothetical protein SAMN05444272_0127 [Roseibium suaedae]
MLKTFGAFAAGLIFGTGILLSGMGNPAKVLNFFDLAGTWDPSLMFVMGGALAVTFIGYRLVFQMKRPLLAASFSLPTSTVLDARLIGGAAIFGIGWGIAGFCPGGLLPVIGYGQIEPFIMLGGILTGMIIVKAVTASGSKTAPAGKAAPRPAQG